MCNEKSPSRPRQQSDGPQRPDRLISVTTGPDGTSISEISMPDQPSEDGSTPSPSGMHGPPSPSELQRIRDLGGLAQAPALTGPLSICGPGSPDSGGEALPLSSLLLKKLGEEGYICTLYLDPPILESVLKHSGGAGLPGTVAVTFSLSTGILEL